MSATRRGSVSSAAASLLGAGTGDLEVIGFVKLVGVLKIWLLLGGFLLLFVAFVGVFLGGCWCFLGFKLGCFLLDLWSFSGYCWVVWVCC